MLAKKYRLTSSRDFSRIESSGKTFQSDNFGVGIFDRGDKNPPRFGFVVSTKVAKDAVDRNTIRRHMSETVRMLTGDIKDGLDIAFLAKPGIIRVPADSIVREVREAIRKSGICK